VLVALLVLAIGLVGAQGLSLAAARAMGLAEREGRVSSLAADSLESALAQLRSGEAPSQFCRRDLPFGDRLSRTIHLAAPTLAVVRISVEPSSSARTPEARPLELASAVFLPRGLDGAIAGEPCD
jgi:hypothetical protein